MKIAKDWVVKPHKKTNKTIEGIGLSIILLLLFPLLLWLENILEAISWVM